MAGVLFQWEYRIEEWDKEGRSLEVWLLSNDVLGTQAAFHSIAERHPAQRFLMLHRARIVERRGP